MRGGQRNEFRGLEFGKDWNGRVGWWSVGKFLLPGRKFIDPKNGEELIISLVAERVSFGLGGFLRAELIPPTCETRYDEVRQRRGDVSSEEQPSPRALPGGGIPCTTYT